METQKLAEIERVLNDYYAGAKLNSHIYIFKKPIETSNGVRVKNIARNNDGVITAFVKHSNVRSYQTFQFKFLDEETKELIYNEMVKQ